jgi:2-polyprenyl-6-methoxyphenol hydroxylase-like FAD-dependent oxidoreductase
MSSETSERFDVVIVGARCAGSPLATFLKRAGLSVCVIDQTDFPSDTLSTHMFQIGGIEVLQKLGVLDSVLESGAPPITSSYMKFEDVDLSGPPRLRANDIAVRATHLARRAPGRVGQTSRSYDATQ